MKIIYSKQAKGQLLNIKKFISKDNKEVANKYLLKIKRKIELISHYPYIGKINTTINKENIRDFVVCGYKVIYKINDNSINILAIYKYIDFDENEVL